MKKGNIQGHGKQLAGQVKQHWGKLTADDLRIAEGNAEYLSGKLQQRDGIARDQADQQVKAFEKQLCHSQSSR